MADTLAAEGYAETATPDDADLVILNTCHIREKAAEKVYSELGRLRELKAGRARAQGRDVMIAVAGCVAQAEGEEIIRRAPAVDLVVGPQSYHRLPELLARAAQRRASSTPIPGRGQVRPPAAPSRAAIRSAASSAFLTVQEGCDKFCTFCVVPYTRGAEVSRPVATDRRRGRRLADAGVREITLLGQNVNAYHGEGAGRRGLDARPAAAPARRDPGHRAAALHHQPSARHGRRADRRASRSAGADAVSASAGAVGLGPHPRGDEPPPHRATTISRSSSACARRGPTSRSRRISSSAFPARPRTDFERHAAAGRRGRLRQRLLVQIFAAPRHAGAEMDDQVPEAVKAERLQRLQDAARAPAGTPS